MTKGTNTIAFEAVPLPLEVCDLLEKNSKLLQALDYHLTQSMGGRTAKYDLSVSLNAQTLEQLTSFRQQLMEMLGNSANPEWKTLLNHLWSFGPKKCGPNILVNGVKEYNRPNIFDLIDKHSQHDYKLQNLDSSIINGFQLATLSGPICAEPLRGVAFVLRQWQTGAPSVPATVTLPAVSEAAEDEGSDAESETSSLMSGSVQSIHHHGTNSGQMISLVKEACMRAFQAQPQRLMCAMYSCNIQATATVLGKVYGVIGKREGRVTKEDMQEGTQIFNITAVLPVAQSFGFSDEIRKRTSGLASPQLSFSHWEVIDVDPFWEPCTEEEMAHYGEKYDSENRAKNYMNQVRKRKGLKVEEKIVMHAEKQRTLGKKK